MNKNHSNLGVNENVFIVMAVRYHSFLYWSINEVESEILSTSMSSSE
jgi:hypothetical protein